MGIRILRILEENLALAEKLSVVFILLLEGDLVMTLYFPQDSECINGLRMLSSRLSLSANSSKLMDTAPLNVLRSKACSVETCKLYNFLPNVALTEELPSDNIQVSFLLACLFSCQSLKTPIQLVISGKGRSPETCAWTRIQW